MKLITALILCALIVGCASPAAPTREPTKPPGPVIIDTIPPAIVDTIKPADTATYTPIANTPTLQVMLTASPTLTDTVTSTRRATLKPTLKATSTRRPPTITRIPTVFVPPTVTQPAPRVCCKICTTGLACGDSCISRTKTCHQPPGCACQG